MELKDTSEWMTSEDYKERFVAEYAQLKIRYEKLKSYCNKIEANSICPTKVTAVPHDCPLELLRAQQKAMGEYLHILEIRGLIELEGKHDLSLFTILSVD